MSRGTANQVREERSVAAQALLDLAGVPGRIFVRVFGKGSQRLHVAYTNDPDKGGVQAGRIDPRAPGTLISNGADYGASLSITRRGNRTAEVKIQKT